MLNDEILFSGRITKILLSLINFDGQSFSLFYFWLRRVSFDSFCGLVGWFGDINGLGSMIYLHHQFVLKFKLSLVRDVLNKSSLLLKLNVRWL